jgi:hypothetical protein
MKEETMTMQKARGAAAFLMVFLVVLLGSSGVAWASSHQEKKMEGGDPMAVHAKLGEVGAHHKALEPMAGNFNTTVKIWMAPGQQPLEIQGTVEAHWILGGRYLESTHKGDMGGHPFEGRGTEGYDNQNQRYVSTWIDNQSTGPMSYTGSASADGKVFTLSADFVDPMTNQKMVNKGVTTILDQDSYKYESYLVGPDGKEFKNLEVMAKRK